MPFRLNVNTYLTLNQFLLGTIYSSDLDIQFNVLVYTERK